MKYKFFPLVLLTGLLLLSQRISANTTLLVLENEAGQIVKLGSYLGKKPVYLKFWATWCKPCMEQMPHFQHAYEQYGDKIQFVAINIDLNDDAHAVAKVKERFSLSMPLFTDHTGQVAKHYEFMGTPFHVLIDSDEKVIFQGHEADKSLDNTLRLLSHNGKVEKARLLSEKQGQATPLTIPKKGKKAVLFTATWCDWYLADTRPAMAKQCVLAQQHVNKLAEQGIDVEVKVSQLWTDQSAVQEYVDKFSASMSVSIDYGNDLFLENGINSVPTLLIYNDGKLATTQAKF
ncbi:TlpA family protein disulfide reductase [Pseudoalteromonas sp. 68 DY56-GL68]|uniref:TlpA family protein disulfide reductase n=1 Tax=Pseudoalteromonas sp. 68 DY56-GL68 TaxID=2974919 RepID=UPI00352A0A72